MTPTPTTPFPVEPPSTLDEGVSCKPNISPNGRRARRRWGMVWASVTIAGMGACLLLRAPWYYRALVGIPAALSGVGFLQAFRGTCVSRAAEGTIEHDDMSFSRAEEPDAVRSRLAAAAIGRDTLFIGVAVGVGAAASVLWQ